MMHHLLVTAMGLLMSLAVAAEPAVAAAWAPVDALMQQRSAEKRFPAVKGMGLIVFDRDDRKVFEKAYGDFASDREVAIASASKLVSGVLIFDVIATSQGRLTLDSTTGGILGWTGPKAAITVRHLLSFTSGMAKTSNAIDPDISLAEAVAALAAIAPAVEPGTRFDYDSGHLQVAGRMAEVVTGKPWNTLFRERIADPLRLPAGVTYYARPNRSMGTANPLIAGGMRASLASYAPILAVAFHRGSAAGITIGSAELFDAQAREPFRVVIGSSPLERHGLAFRYGLASWLEGADPQAGSDIISSAGAFGFTPWLDRRAGYYAILGMEVFGGAKVSVPIQQELQPLIRAALGRP